MADGTALRIDPLAEGGACRHVRSGWPRQVSVNVGIRLPDLHGTRVANASVEGPTEIEEGQQENGDREDSGS